MYYTKVKQLVNFLLATKSMFLSIKKMTKNTFKN